MGSDLSTTRIINTLVAADDQVWFRVKYTERSIYIAKHSRMIWNGKTSKKSEMIHFRLSQ
jgi:hypothetical protein